MLFRSGNSSKDYNFDPNFWISTGGNPVIATMVMANWHGPASESATNSAYVGLTAADSLSSSYAYSDVLHLENSYALDIATADNRATLKSLIRAYGSAVVCFYYDTKYLFTGTPAPAATSAPTPTATPAGTGGMPFTDVVKGAWYYSDVEASWTKGLVNGMTDTTYVPGGTATRAQIVAVLHRLSGNAAPTASSVAFDDVTKGSWYYDDVRWAQSLGIINGSDDNNDGVYSFRPNATITRQEFMTILFRYAKQTGKTTSQTTSLASFPDASKVSSWASEAMSWSVASGLQKGVADSSGTVKLDPSGTVTRAQLAAFLNRFSGMS